MRHEKQFLTQVINKSNLRTQSGYECRVESREGCVQSGYRNRGGCWVERGADGGLSLRAERCGALAVGDGAAGVGGVRHHGAEGGDHLGIARTPGTKHSHTDVRLQSQVMRISHR